MSRSAGLQNECVVCGEEGCVRRGCVEDRMEWRCGDGDDGGIEEAQCVGKLLR
jgi:hypothetical protein